MALQIPKGGGFCKNKILQKESEREEIKYSKMQLMVWSVSVEERSGEFGI